MHFFALSQLLPVSYISATAGNNAVNATDKVSTIAKLISEYGTEVVIIAVFILLFIGLGVTILKMQNTMMTNYMEQNNKMLEKILGKKIYEDKVEAEEKEKAKLSKQDIVNKFIYADKVFADAAIKVVNDLRCDRAAIYVFHNGNKTPYGYGFVKMTCIHEQTIRGTGTSRGKFHQGVPLHVFSTIIDCLIRNNEYIVGNVYSHGYISADEQVRNFIDGYPTKALFALSIKNNNGEIAGFVVAEWVDEQDFSNPINYNKALESLKHMRDSIRPIVVDSDFRSQYEMNRLKEAQ